MAGRSTFLLLTFILILAIAGCGGGGVSGKYVSERTPGNYVELKSDGTFYASEKGIGLTGKYEIQGDQITLKTEMGLGGRGKIKGNTIVWEDGDRTTRQ